MVKLIDIPALRKLTQKVGVVQFISRLVDRLEQDFARWPEFHKSPRHATHYEHGVLELMPTADKQRYSFKYVNGHPVNTATGELCVTGVGMLANVSNGYPLLISEMTILTALRTAATSALAVKYLKTADYDTVGIIGTGAQAEFQILAMTAVLPIKQVKYYDIDPHAMTKFSANLKDTGLQLLPCATAQEVVTNTPLLITATAAKRKQSVLESEWVRPGTLILGVGGDCPGKTELPFELTKRCKFFVEDITQTHIEGELQYFGTDKVYAELWEVIAGKKKAHGVDDDVLLFDSVGFAIEDFSALNLVYDLSIEYGIGVDLNLIPRPSDPKNLYAELV